MRPSAESGVPTWLADELTTVPDIDAFAGVDELAEQTARLAAAHPDTITSRVVGHSARGEALTCLTVDGGPTARADAVVFGLAHPNEPAGSLTSLHLAGRLAADRALRRGLGLHWHIVPVIDPDGLRLNDGWLRGPFTREHYTRTFYRQASDEQIDWNFPLGGESTRSAHRRPDETVALMHLIDGYRPALLASLHNGEFGDVYYYVGRKDPQWNDPQLTATLQQIPAALDMAIYRGVPESPWARRTSDGVYRPLDIHDSIAYERAAGRHPSIPTGNCSSVYAAERGALSLIPEVPYWRDPRTSDSSPSRVALAETLFEAGERLAEIGSTLAAALDAIGGVPLRGSRFLRAGRHFTDAVTATAIDTMRRATRSSPERLATVAERASTENSVHLYRLRHTGIMIRALDAEIAAGNRHEVIHSVRAELVTQHATWSAEDVEASKVAGVVRNSIGSMIAVQYGSIIGTADRVAGTR